LEEEELGLEEEEEEEEEEGVRWLDQARPKMSHGAV